MTQPETMATTEQVDLYREVHKGLRIALFELVGAAGSLDVADPGNVEDFRRRFADVDMMLTTHHRHEDGAELVALVAEHAETVADVVAVDHERFEMQMADLRSLIADLAAGVDRSAATYDTLTAFVADYLAHMQVEETQVMPALRAGVPVDVLMGITMTIRTSVPPPDMCVFLRYMLPAMTPDERTATLGGMKAGAPPEIFEMFWGVAEANLTSPDLATVAERIRT